MTDRPPDLPLEVPLDGPSGDLDTTMRNLVASRWKIMSLLPQAGGWLVGGLVGVNLVIGLLPVVFVVATSVVLGKVPEAVRGGTGSAATDSLMWAFAIAAIAFVALQVVAPLGSSLGALLARRIDRAVYDELMRASLRSAGVGPLEDPQMLDELRIAGLKLEFAIFSPGSACSGLLALIARYIQLAGFAAVVGAVFSWLAGLGLVVAVALIRYAGRGGLSKYAAARRRLSAAERKGYYLRELAIESGAGREIRVFGLLGWITRAYRDVYQLWLNPLWTVRRQALLHGFLQFAGWGLAVATVVFGVIGAMAVSTLTLTALALVLQSAVGALRLSGYYPEADLQTAIGVSGYGQVEHFAKMVDTLPPGGAVAPIGAVASDSDMASGSDMAPDSAAAPDSVVATTGSTAAAEPVRGIHFDDVTFGYPGQDRPVFSGLNLVIPVGRCTAIVGVNGAGKTTLVKLLARLYEPTSGVIRLDGVDIRSYPIDEWRSKIAVVFQEFLRYEVSAADNIGFGAIDSLDDADGIRAAATAVGIVDALDALPNGLDTPLAPHLNGGVDLSGGQWQRVALARALFAMRHGSSIAILDEPTASLDMRTEATFFEQFADLTRNATTVLISHRFSTVRQADTIVVLDQGLVTEQGSHDELMAVDGTYARLFQLQGSAVTGVEPDVTAESGGARR